MNITPQQVAAAYDMLRHFKPFDRWKLPESDAVGFHVKALTKEHGFYQWTRGHNITISSHTVDSCVSLMDTTAHEMIHLYQEMKKTSGRTQHNAEFKRLAKQVCKEFLWDYKRFIW